ncbi:MAG: hypothetical protein GY913_00185 [Proteobacteria bacterium]|nr:hypothetical protein [Pseudomonadota bacterium]MCP4915315.1 hypothetical protein [Pseudomonadota bacterium]
MFLLLSALLSCAGNTGVAVVDDGLVVTAPTREERLTLALEKASSAVPHDDALLGLKAGGAEFNAIVDAPEKLRGMPENITLLPMFDGELDDLWWTTDEAEIHAKLIEKQVSLVVLHRSVTPSIDRGRWVASRLYHDDHRERFALAYVDKNFLVYEVLPAPISFPPNLAKAIATEVRNRVKGESKNPMPPLQTETGKKWNLIATLRAEGGRELATGMCVRGHLDDCVDELANDVEREHRRFSEWNGRPKLQDEIDDLIIEIHRVTERGRVLDGAYDNVRVESVWEMGIDGAIIIDYDIQPPRAAVMPGSVSYTRSYRSADQFLRHAAEDGRLSTKRPWREATNSLEKIRTIHYMEWPSGALVPLFRGVPPVPMSVVDMTSLERSVVRGGDWYLRNLAPFDQPLPYEDGQVVYKMWPSENRYSDEYNLVRHTLATWNLVLAYNLDPQEEYLEGARSALDYTLKWRKDEVLPDGTVMTFIEFPGDGDPSVPALPVAELPNNHNRKLGSVVVGLMGMIDLARATDDHQWDEMMVQMGEFVLHQQDEDGKFQPYYVPPGHPYEFEVNDIVPGEAALALVMLYEYTGDDKWLEPLPGYFEFYEPWWDSRETQKSEVSAWPRYIYPDQTRLDLVQFGPWSVMAANAYYRATGDDAPVDFAFKVGHWMVESYMWTEETAPWPDYVGGYYKFEGELPAMQAFCYAEGTAAAYQLALATNRPEEVEFFEKATRESSRLSLQMQYDDLNTYAFSRGDEVWGGTRYAMNETKVRIDYVHHSLSAVYQYVVGAREDANLPEGVKNSQLREQMDSQLGSVRRVQVSTSVRDAKAAAELELIEDLNEE